MKPDLSIEQLYVLLHLRKAKVDYAKMMAKLTGLPLESINESISSLVERGFVERDSGSAIKKSKAKFKKAYEVHKHHTYYRLTREGSIFARKIDDSWLRKYFRELTGEDVFPAVVELSKRGRARSHSEALKRLGFLTDKGRKTKFFEAFSYVAGLR